MLKVRLLEAGAKAPVCSRPGEDLGYDLFALEDTVLYPHVVTKVRTGVAVEAFQSRRMRLTKGIDKQVISEHDEVGGPVGLIIKDRSSMASKGFTVSGGVIDAGYRGEIVVLLTKNAGMTWGEPKVLVTIKAGDKIAQLVPVPVYTGSTQIVPELTEANRGEKSFGSSGR